jgi:hypothetical protein
MKIFLTTTLALSTICILEAPQPAHAIPSDSNFHLARGGHFGRGGDMRPIERGEETSREYTGEGRNLDDSSEGHTSEASRVEDRVHTLSDEAGKSGASEGVTDGGRVHDLGKYDNGADWGGVCPENQTLGLDGVTCVPATGTGTTSIPSTDWTTVQ